MRRQTVSRLQRGTSIILMFSLLAPQPVWARGGGGGGGGRGGGGGGGGMRGGAGAGGGMHTGGGGGAGRPANPGMGHAGAGANQLGGGAGRGAGGAGGNRGPGGEGRGANQLGPGGNRAGAGAGNKAGVGTRPGVENRSNTGIGNRNAVNNSGNRAGISNRTNTINNKSGNTFNRNVNVNNYGGWGNRAGYYHGYNNYWHHGYWHSGYWGWGPGWGGAVAWGLAGWGLGSLYYSSGYGAYSNPYYVSTPASSGTCYDYSAPIQVAADMAPADDQNADASEGDAGPPPSPETAAALKIFDAARDAFKAGNYDEAQRQIDAALKQLPNDAALHEFRGLVQFAQGKYQEAAATVYAVLSVGPGWDWTTLSSMYDSIEVYTKQLRALEAYRKSKLESPDAAFLLAYHYLTGGHTDAAIKQLDAVVKLLPEDQLAPQLLTLLKANTGDSAQAPPAINPPSGDAPPTAEGNAPDDGPPVDKSTLIGTWKASRGKSTMIQLKLTGNDTFVWTATQAGKANPIEGTFSVEGNLLLLQQKSDGNTMIGKVTPRAQGGFNFKMLGSPPSDSGLDFGR